MKYQIENKNMSISIETLGAELQSIVNRETGLEYLWNADPLFWGKKSPPLFPIVGSLKNDQYTHNGKSYSMTRHGFARESEFQVTDLTESSVVFSLKSSEATFKKYPFHFNFSIGYTLEQNRLRVSYSVENEDDQEMPFSVGAHPAFKVPLVPGTRFEDYRLQFEKRETEVSWLLTPEGLVEDRFLPLLNHADSLPLTKELFYNGALVFKHLASKSIAIVSEKTQHGLRVHFEGFHYHGIWSAKNAHFVCLEPWCGIGDSVSSTGELLEKEGIQILPSKKLFERTWTIETF